MRRAGSYQLPSGVEAIGVRFSMHNFATSRDLARSLHLNHSLALPIRAPSKPPQGLLGRRGFGGGGTLAENFSIAKDDLLRGHVPSEIVRAVPGYACRFGE